MPSRLIRLLFLSSLLFFSLLLTPSLAKPPTAAAAAAADDDEFRNPQQLPTAVQQNRELEEKKVCVTSGVSFLGIAIVNQLLLRGYSVRVIVEKQGANILFCFSFLLLLTLPMPLVLHKIKDEDKSNF